MKKINNKVWSDLMNDALLYSNKTFSELREPYMFDLEILSDKFIEKIKEIIYDLRNDSSFDHFKEGIHMIDPNERLIIDYNGTIGIGSPCPSTKLHITTNTVIRRAASLVNSE